MEVTTNEPYEYDVTINICGESVVMVATINEVQAEVTVWAEDDYSVTWERASVAFSPVGIDEPIWELDVFASDIDVVRNITDAQISDACDEIAGIAFRQQQQEGTWETI